MFKKLNKDGIGVVAILIFSVLEAAALPAPDLMEPDRDYAFPAGFQSFDFSFSDEEPVDGTPQVAEWTRSGQPGDILVLTGEDLSRFTMDPVQAGRDSHYLVMAESIDGKITNDCSVSRIEENQSAVELPALLPADTFYLLWPGNEKGLGRPVSINRAEAWWVGFDTVPQGGTFHVYGRNLSLGSGGTHLYVKELNRWVDSEGTNPFKATFKMPANVAPGVYTVYVHNGHGGEYGWSRELLVTVEAPFYWNDRTVSVTEFGADGTDEADDLQAFKDAVQAAGKGGTVRVPEGTFYLSDRIRFADDVRVVGDDPEKSIISSMRITDDRSSPRIMQVGHNCIVSNLTVQSIFEYANRDLVGVYGRGSGLYDVTIDASADTTAPRSGSPLRLTWSSCTEIKGCTIISDNAVVIDGNEQIRIEDTTFTGIRDANQLMTFKRAESIDINHCRAMNFDESDRTNGFGWCKGRWIAGLGESADCYIGENTTINLLPRNPAPIFELGTPSHITPWTENSPPFEKGRQTLHYDEDIPDELHGWGNHKINSEGRVFHTANLFVDSDDPAYPYHYLDNKYFFVLEVDALNDTITIQADNDRNDLDPGYEFVSRVAQVVDQNSGEQILFEGISTRFAGTPQNVTGQLLVFSDPDGLLSKAKQHASMAHIVKGRGMGQYRRIESIDTATGQVILTLPWRVEPDASSVIHLGGYLDRFAVYGNTFDGRPEGVDPKRHTASAGFQAYGGASDIEIHGNTFSQLRRGVSMISTGANDFRSDETALTQNLFNRVENNTFIGCMNDLFMINTTKYGPLTPTDVSAMGNVFRRNLSENAVDSVYYFSNAAQPGSGLIRFNVFQDNEVNGCSRAIEEVAGVQSQIWIGNRFSGDGTGAGISISSGHVPVLRENEWQGFSSAYDGALPGGVLGMPKRVVRIGGEVDTMNAEIQNSGTAPLEWEASTSAEWLKINTPQGIVADEKAVNALSIELIDTPVEDSQAVVTVSAAGQIQQLTVSYEPDMLQPPPPTEHPSPALISISISGDTSVKEQTTAEFECIGYYADGSSKPIAADWEVASEYASISSGGLLTAGDISSNVYVEVTATVDPLSTATNVLLKYDPPHVISLIISGPAEVNEEANATFSCVAVYSDGSQLSVNPQWSVSGTAATIDENGVLSTGNVTADDEAVVSALFDAASESATVTVLYVPPVLTGITVIGAVSMNEESTLQLSCIASYSDSTTALVTPVWNEDSQSASINDSGLLSAGDIPDDLTVIVGADFGGFVDTHSVLVKYVPPYITGISITGPSALAEETSAQYSCTATYSDGTTQPISPDWAENAAFATISSSGLLSPGNITADQSLTIFASFESYTDSFQVDVQYVPPVLNGLEIQGNDWVNEGESTVLTCIGLYSDGTTDVVYPDWSVDSVLALIDSGGLLSAGDVLEDETVTISAALDAYTANFRVTLKYVPPPVILTGITISGPAELEELQSATFSCVASYSDGTTRVIQPDWSVFSSSVSISASGVLQASNFEEDELIALYAEFEGATAELSVRILSVGNKIRYPLTGFDGKVVRAELFDQQTQTWHDLGVMEGPNELVLEDLNVGQWYWVSIEQSNSVSGAWDEVHANWVNM